MSPKPAPLPEKPMKLSRLAGVPENAGERIRAWRERAGVTQEELAHQIAVTFSTVSRWENGHVLPSRLAWRAVCDLMGIPREV